MCVALIFERYRTCHYSVVVYSPLNLIIDLSLIFSNMPMPINSFYFTKSLNHAVV